MKIIKYALSIFLIGNSLLSPAQRAPEPVNLGPAINSEYEELSPVMSGDGSRLFFVRMNHPDNRYGQKKSQDIWMAEKGANGHWTEAVRLPDKVNIARYNAIFWANETGTEIIVKSVFSRSGKEWKERGFSRIAGKKNGDWGKPEKVHVKGFENKDDGSLSAASFSQNESVLVLSFSTVVNSKKSNIYISKKKGKKYTHPQKITEVSTKYDEQAPFIDSEGKTLYFSSNRGGNFDIYKSVRQDDGKGKWSSPVPLDMGVNTSGWESYFRLVDDEEFALFASNENSIGNADIFRIDIRDGEEYEEEEEVPEYVVFKGVIKDADGRVLPVGGFKLIVDSTETNYASESSDSATFEVKLPPEERYQVTAALPGYSIDTIYVRTQNRGLKPFDIELTGVKVVKAVETPLPAEEPALAGVVEPEAEQPETVKPPDIIKPEESLQKGTGAATIYGEILNSKTNIPVGSIQELTLLVNGEPFSGVIFDRIEKTYRITLEKGKKYVLEGRMKDFFGVAETIDLSANTQNTFETDLYMNPVEVGQTVKLENIIFRAGSYFLLNESIPEIRKISDLLKENPNMRVEIGGHTDGVGNKAYNLRLSEERAKSVARYIILSGVPRERIEFKGYGETQPIAANDSAKGREQNRRVEIKVLKN